MTNPTNSPVSIPVRVMRARSALQHSLLTAEQEKAVTDALDAVSDLFSAQPTAIPASFAATSIDAYMRLITLFDQNEVAGSFLYESGEGGFVGAVYRMAKELERRQQADIKAAFAEPPTICTSVRPDGKKFKLDTSRETSIGTLDETIRQKLKQALRFSVSCSLITSEDERRILAALPQESAR